jgi:hypothetical protein
MKMRGLSDAEGERLEDEDVVFPDKYFFPDKCFRAHGGTLYHVDPDFVERLAPGEDVADAIEARLDTVPCRRREEQSRRDAGSAHASVSEFVPTKPSVERSRC